VILQCDEKSCPSLFIMNEKPKSDESHPLAESLAMWRSVHIELGWFTLRIHFVARARVLNRRRATRIFLNAWEIEQGKTGAELEKARELNWTHTTLPLCVPAAPETPQKTASYAPIQSDRRDRKARVCHGLAYGRAIEPQYFNGLRYRRVFPLSAQREC
jgi:hypothetical protein